MDLGNGVRPWSLEVTKKEREETTMEKKGKQARSRWKHIL